MTIIRVFFWFFLSVSVLSLSGGCATLPNVTATMRDVPASQEPRQIGSAKELLSPKQSKALGNHFVTAVFENDLTKPNISKSEFSIDRNSN